MIDKINIVSQNYFKSNCKDLREEMGIIYEQLFIHLKNFIAAEVLKK